jgi:hypothetical protein
MALVRRFQRTCCSLSASPDTVVPPEERTAAASVTNVPRSLAAALPPLVTGAMLAHSTVGWPLVCAGLLKAVYDVLVLAQFRSVPPRGDEE